MVGKLPDGVITFPVGPASLLIGQIGNGDIKTYKVLGFAVRAAELVDKDGPECRCRLLLCSGLNSKGYDEGKCCKLHTYPKSASE